MEEPNSINGEGGRPEQAQSQLDRLAQTGSQRRIDPAQIAASISPAAERLATSGEVKSDTAKPEDGSFMKQLGERFFRRKEQVADTTMGDSRPLDDPAVEATRKPKLAADKRELADDIESRVKARYTVVPTNQGKKVELYEPGVDKPAISLDARSISTTADRGTVVQDVVTLARDRGWQTLKVSGSATFKDEVWLEAAKQGLKAGHQPSPRMQAEFDKWQQQNPNTVATARPEAAAAAPKKDDLGQSFTRLSPEERLADPRFKNAQLELAIANRLAEREIGKPITEMPEVECSLVGAIASQLREGKVFNAPYIKPVEPVQVQQQQATPTQAQVAAPKTALPAPAVQEAAPLRQQV